MLSFILNLPYSIIGIIVALLSIPVFKIDFRAKPYAIIFNVKSFWWYTWLPKKKGARAMAVGHIVLLVVLLGPNLEKNDLEHELIHVEQHARMPLIQPFLYHAELFRKGYRNNKYEIEAYSRAGNIYKE